MKKLKNETTGRLETEEDLDEAVAKIANPKKKGKTRLKPYKRVKDLDKEPY